MGADGETGQRAGKVALVVGAGDFLGGAIAKRFAREGYHLVITRRRGDLEGVLNAIHDAGGSATGFHSDARDEDEVIALFERIERDSLRVAYAIPGIGRREQKGWILDAVPTTVASSEAKEQLQATG